MDIRIRQFDADRGNAFSGARYLSIVIGETVFGDSHAYTADTYKSLADVLTQTGKPEKALGYYRNALMIYQTIWGADDSRTKEVGLAIESINHRLAADNHP